MVQVKLKSLERAIEVGRIIGKYSQNIEGPKLLVTAGIHGNETSGVAALQKIFDELKRANYPFKGEFIGLAGNLGALAQGVRFLDEDMNRAFTAEKLTKAKSGDGGSAEAREAAELLRYINKLRGENVEQIYFVDCHTTSSESLPYISVEKHPASLEFALKFPVYIVEEKPGSFGGSIDSYLIGMGNTGFTFEAGQHDDMASIENQEAAIWLALANSGCISADTPQVSTASSKLRKTILEGSKRFEVVYTYKISEGENFKMKPGYINFQKIDKGEVLAYNKNGPIQSRWEGRIFMPLYQAQGESGFYIVKKIN
nr:succinylglutamate desuccinylase/aspartoacylase family protein [Bacteroidota bacterium]